MKRSAMELTPGRLASRAAQLARLPRTRKIALWLGGAVAAFAIIGFLVAPPIVRSQLEDRLSERLGRHVTIERVRINPFTLSASVLGFNLKERDGSTNAVNFDELHANLALSSLFRLAPVIEEVRLAKPFVRVVRNEDKSYNFQDITDKLASGPPSPPGPPPRFAVYNISMTDGRVEFDDRPEKKQHAVTDLRIGIPFISSLPAHVDIKVLPELSAKVNGTPVGLVGETKPFKNTHETLVRIDLDDVQVPKYLDYSPVPLRFRVPSGRLDTRLVVALATRDDRLSDLTVSGTATLEKLTVQELGGGPLVALDALNVELDSVDLLARNANLTSLRIEAPSIDLKRRKDGRINLLTAFAEPKDAAPASKTADTAPPFRFSVADIALANGTVRVVDEVPAKPQRIELQQISLTAQRLSNAPDAKADAQLRFVTDAQGKLAYDGTVRLAPVRVGGKVEFADFRLAVLQPHVEETLNLQVADGTLSVAARFDIGMEKETFGGRVEDVSAMIKELRLLYPGDKEPLWRVPLVEVRDAAIDLNQRLITVGSALVKTPAVHVRRDADGSTHFARLFKHSYTARPKDAGRAQAEWRVEAKRLALADGTVVFDDRVPPNAVVTRLTRLALDVQDFSSIKGARFKAAVRTVVNGKGSVSVSGPLRQAPLSGNLRIDAKGVELAPFQPYLDEYLDVALTGGAISTKGALAFDVADGALKQLTYRGDVNVADFASLDRAGSQDLLKWRSLFLGGIDFAAKPLKAAVDEIALSDFYSRLIVNADGTLNLQGIVKKPNGQSAAPDGAPAAQTVAGEQPASDASTAPAPPAARALPSNIRIGGVTLQGGNVNFSDFFVKPNYSANLTDVGGAVTEMTREKAGDVELRGRVDHTAPLEILGKVNVLSPDLFVDLKASAKDIELPPFSPYAVKYAGYGIERGKLSVNVKYFIENRKLAAENNIFLDQLTFGAKVDSPTATKLPVTLAVALLKDRNGVIDVNLPISGSLDDPQFSLGGVIVRVIVNLIVKAVTAPFALLGSLFGGGEELAYVEFAPGSANLDADDESKLRSLAKALNERPGLKLDVSGRIETEVDREGLKRVSLERRVKGAKLKETSRSGAAAGTLEDVKVDPSEYAKYLTLAYRDAKFAKPRNAIGLVKELPVPEMEQLMLANTEVSEEDLRQLANARAQSAKDWLVENGKISPERVFLISPKVSGEQIKDKGKPTRVDFSLK